MVQLESIVAGKVFGFDKMRVRFFVAVVAFLIALWLCLGALSSSMPSSRRERQSSRLAGHPFPNEVIDKRVFFRGCSSWADAIAIEIATWGLIVTASGYLDRESWCESHYVLPFNETAGTDMLYYTTAIGPNEGKCRYESGKAYAWGRTRSEFVQLIRMLNEHAQMARQYRICEGYDLNYTRSEVSAWLEHDRVANAAVYYLTTIAYRNSFRNELNTDRTANLSED